MDSEALALAESVKSSNDARAANAKEFVGALYFFIALVMFFYAVNVAVLTSWLKKFPCIPKMKHINDVKPALINLGAHTLVVGTVYYLITAAGGVIGMGVMTGLFVILSIGLIVVVMFQRNEYFIEEHSPELSRSTKSDATSPLQISVEKRSSNDEQSASENPLAKQPSVEENSSAIQHEDTLPSSLVHKKHLSNNDSIQKLHQSTALHSGILGSEGGTPNYMVPTNYPLAISVRQLKWYVVSLLLVFLVLIILIIMGFAFGAKDYTIIRGNESVIEFQPKIASTALVAMYIYPGTAGNMRMQWPVEKFTFKCGDLFRKELKSTADKKTNIQEAWIDKYDINMSNYVRPYYLHYASANDWFTRQIRMELRPLPNVSNAIVSPADCRLLVFQNSDDSEVWVKGSKQSAQSITGDVAGEYWKGGAMVIARLAPQDYHRFHSPVSGRITSVTHISGTYWSVSSDAARSENDAFLNKRVVVVISASFGDVAFVAVGATCVGSVLIRNSEDIEFKVGDNVTIGDQLGIMQFGGSTVVLYLPPNIASMDAALLQRSQLPVETQVLTNEQIGTFS